MSSQKASEYVSYQENATDNIPSNQLPKKSLQIESKNQTPPTSVSDVGIFIGDLTNPFGEIISDYDIKVSYDALSALSADKQVAITQFAEWINNYLQLNWDESRIKRAWAVLEIIHKYITFKEFKSG
eukprot:499197_1